MILERWLDLEEAKKQGILTGTIHNAYELVKNFLNLRLNTAEKEPPLPQTPKNNLKDTFKFIQNHQDLTYLKMCSLTVYYQLCSYYTYYLSVYNLSNHK